MLARKTGHNCQKIQRTLVIIYTRSYPFGYKREDFSCSIGNCGRVPHHFGFCNLKIHAFITTEEKTLVVSWYNLPASFCMKVLFAMSYGNISDRILWPSVSTKKRFRINWSWSLFSKGRLPQMLKRKTGAQVWNSNLIFKKDLSFCGSLCAKSWFGLIQNVYLFCQDWIDSAIHFNMQQRIFTARNEVAAR